MAKYYFGMTRGNGIQGCSVNTSTTGKEIEIVMDNTYLTSKNELLVNLDVLENFILQCGWPPL